MTRAVSLRMIKNVNVIDTHCVTMNAFGRAANIRSGWDPGVNHTATDAIDV